MPTIKAFKMDGLGNKFVIVDRRKDIVNITKEKIIHLGKLESFHREIGFDQIIFIEREIDKTFPITIFNSDGGEVSACGNGSRCVAYLLGKDLNTKEVKLKTNNRLLNAKIVGELDVEFAIENFGAIPENTNFGIKSSVVRSILESQRVSMIEEVDSMANKRLLGDQITKGTYYISCWMTTAQIQNMKEKKVRMNELRCVRTVLP